MHVCLGAFGVLQHDEQERELKMLRAQQRAEMLRTRLTLMQKEHDILRERAEKIADLGWTPLLLLFFLLSSFLFLLSSFFFLLDTPSLLPSQSCLCFAPLLC